MEVFPTPLAGHDLTELLKGSTLVVPAVAWANVGELAVDALVHNLKLPLVAQLEDLNVLPAVGNDPYTCRAPGGAVLCTALELYHLPQSRVFVLQQRAPAALGRQAAAAQVLADWAASAGVRRVVVLAGLDAQQRSDLQLDAPQHQAWYLPGSAVDAATDSAAGGTQLPTTSGQDDGTGSSSVGGGDSSSSSGDDLSQLCRADGASFALLEEATLQEELRCHRLLPPWPLLAALAARSIPRLLLAVFAAEGDNGPDGLQLCQAVLQLLRQGAAAAGGGDEALLPAAPSPQQPLAAPCSWALGLYGRDPMLQYA